MVYEKDCKACLTVFQYEEKPFACPHCGETFWDKPGDERALFKLQHSYLEGGRTNSKHELDKMYVIVVKYIINIVKRKVKRNGLGGITPDRLKAIGAEMGTRLIETYIQKPTFVIKDSFGALMKFSLGGVMSPTDSYEEHCAFSFDQTIGDSGVSFYEHPDQAPIVRQKSSDQQEWESVTTFHPLHRHSTVQHDVIDLITKLDDKIFYYHGWAAAMLFAVSLKSKLTDRRSLRKLSHLQEQYSRIPIMENIDMAELTIRTSATGGY